MRRGILVSACLTVFVAATTVGFGAMTVNWQYSAGAAGNPWLATATSGCRGIAYNPVTDNVVIASTDGGTTMAVLKAADGTYSTAGSMNITGVSGGQIAVCKPRIVVTGAGSYSVYVSNMILNNKTASLQIYRWTGTGGAAEGTLGAPTVIYRNRASDGTAEASPVGPTMPAAGASTFRIGDGMDALYNSGTNTTSLYVGRSDGAVQNHVYRFDVDEATAAVTITDITLTGATGTGYTGTGVDPAGNIFHFSSATISRYDSTGGNKTNFPAAMQVNCGSPRYGTIGGRNYVGFVDPTTAGPPTPRTFQRIGIADVTNGITAASVIDFSPVTVVPNVNANGTGDMDFDTLRGRFVAVITNNLAGSYSLSAGTTKTWDAGAATTKWYDAANWNPNGVPQGVDNVVLDNSSVSGAYDVYIDNWDTQACKTLTVGDASSGNQIRLRVDSIAASIAQQALCVAGSQDATDDIVIRNGGRVENASVATAGNVIMNMSGGATIRIQAGGYYLHDTARGFSGVFPASGNGALTCDTGSTVEFAQASGVAATLSGRTYGSLVLSATAAKTYTGAGGGGTTITNTLTIGPNVTFNPSMTTLPTVFQGNIVNNGNGGTLTNTGGVTFDGTSTISGNAGLIFAGGFTVNATKSLALANTITANGPVSILGTLSGNGTIAGSGAVALGANGLVSPGNSVGALTVGPLTIDGKYLYEIVAGVADLITVNGNLTVGGTSVLEGPNAPSVNYATPGLVQVDDGGTWRTIIAYSGSLAGTFATVPVELSAFQIE